MKKIVTIAVVALLLGITGSVYALSLQEAAIDGNIQLDGFSFDNDDGIIWLDNSETVGKTIAEMNTLASNYGLQWADKTMVKSLFLNLSNITCWSTSTEGDITGAFTVYDSGVPLSYLYGYLLTDRTDKYKWEITEWRRKNAGTSAFEKYTGVFKDESYSKPNVGGYLYKNSAPVPEPSTILLLGGGLAGLIFYRRKKK